MTNYRINQTGCRITVPGMLFLVTTAIFLMVTVMMTPGAWAQDSTSRTSPVIYINGLDEGRLFEGVGAVSAGGSSRLLIDYPEPYRSDILNILFTPKFGASLQHLKVEIGGDVNSTAGTEPSHARTREELEHPKRAYYHRGYEYWLMKEARKRNPDMIFDCLQWGAPGWFQGGFYSQDNADYIVSFIQGAKKYHDVAIRFAGTWNEKRSPHTRDWIVNVLRPTLDHNGLSHVGIVADDWHTPQWQFAAEVVADSALRNAVYALGYHYVESTSTDTALLTGLPLWESEAWSKSGEWPHAFLLAKQLNLNYIKGKITKTEIWNPVDAYYENLAWAGMGAMTASTPWNGHYEVEPAIWALAHTTQFTSPGWIYVECGCDTTANGSYFVTLKKPADAGQHADANPKADYSLIITGGRQKETLRFRVSNLSEGALNVWQTDSTRQFVHQRILTPENGYFAIDIAPYSIYSLTTTTGQQKGTGHPIPPASEFPSPYAEDFERYAAGSTPAFFADQGGAFEVFQAKGKRRAKGENKTLRQVITGKLIPWDSWGPNNPEPYTEFGEPVADFDVSVRALVEDSGTVKLFGRVHYFESNKSAHGYGLTVDHRGNWRLLQFEHVLDSGKVAFSANNWHALRLRFRGDTIQAFIDEKQVSTVRDTTYSAGYAGLGTGWNHARFDDVHLEVYR